MQETTEIPVEFLFTLRLCGVAVPDHLFATPWGGRRESRVKGGQFAGPALNGVVVEGLANDWGAVADDGTIGIDANIVLKTDAGEALFMTFRGRTGSDGRTRIVPLFETSDGPLGYLTEIMATGVGGVDGDDLVLDIFTIR